MRSIAVLFALSLSVVGQPLVLTQNVDNTYVDTSWHCNNNGLGLTNRYYRVYRPADHGVTTPIDVVGVRLGVALSTTIGTTAAAEVRLWAESTATWPLASGRPTEPQFTLLAEKSVTGPSLTVPFATVTLDSAVRVLPDDKVIVEVHDIDQAVSAENFKIGMNMAGETAHGFAYQPYAGCSPSSGTFYPAIIQYVSASTRSVVMDLLYNPIGAACPASAACLSLADPANAPTLGQSFSILLHAPEANADCYVFADLQTGAIPMSVGGGITYTQIAFTPSVLPLADPTNTFGPSLSNPVTNGNGNWSLTVAVPYDPVLQGLTFYGEGYVLDVVPPLPPNGVFWQTNLLSTTIQGNPTAPSIQSFLPASPSPGESVTVIGSGFIAGLAVDVNGTPAVVVSVTDTEVVYVQPLVAACSATMTVTNPNGTADSVPMSWVPVLTSVTPNSGPATGGGLLFLFGGPFPVGSAVTIGGASAVLNANNYTVMSVIVPPGVPGQAQVVVTTQPGCSVTATYTYL